MNHMVEMPIWVWALLMAALGFQASVIWRLRRCLREYLALMKQATKELGDCEQALRRQLDLRRSP